MLIHAEILAQIHPMTTLSRDYRISRVVVIQVYDQTVKVMRT